jgi:hypothetical protein
MTISETVQYNIQQRRLEVISNCRIESYMIRNCVSKRFSHDDLGAVYMSPASREKSCHETVFLTMKNRFNELYNVTGTKPEQFEMLFCYCYEPNLSNSKCYFATEMLFVTEQFEMLFWMLIKAISRRRSYSCDKSFIIILQPLIPLLRPNSNIDLFMCQTLLITVKIIQLNWNCKGTRLLCLFPHSNKDLIIIVIINIIYSLS